jgi:hypothetical protein
MDAQEKFMQHLRQCFANFNSEALDSLEVNFANTVRSTNNPKTPEDENEGCAL